MTSLIWVPASLVAGLLQAWRTALQQRLRAELSIGGAGLVRYLYGAPIAIVLAAALVKRATMKLDLPDAVASAFTTLAVVMLLQTLMHGAYVALREPTTLRRVAETWRSSGQVGLLAAFGSACWFIGFATAPVALVRIVGQVEVVFTLAFAHIYLREQIKHHENIGLMLVAVGVILALAGALLNHE